MLDKNSRKVLTYFIKTKSNQSWSTLAQNVSLNKDMEINSELVETALNYLLEENYIKIAKGNKYIYELTHHGKMYFANILIKYGYPLLTSAISLLLSLILE